MKRNIAQKLIQEILCKRPAASIDYKGAARLDDREVPSQLPASIHETLPFCLRARLFSVSVYYRCLM